MNNEDTQRMMVALMDAADIIATLCKAIDQVDTVMRITDGVSVGEKLTPCETLTAEGGRLSLFNEAYAIVRKET
jgi:hypothetical protein